MKIVPIAEQRYELDEAEAQRLLGVPPDHRLTEAKVTERSGKFRLTVCFRRHDAPTHRSLDLVVDTA